MYTRKFPAFLIRNQFEQKSLGIARSRKQKRRFQVLPIVRKERFRTISAEGILLQIFSRTSLTGSWLPPKKSQSVRARVWRNLCETVLEKSYEFLTLNSTLDLREAFSEGSVAKCRCFEGPLFVAGGLVTSASPPFRLNSRIKG
ncbi:hypothetical protein AVEN_261693-1 [Araneus ventricosus]|uniref:Uncharacterized protein n=1 Tax=Araneus ventricosus TaxID=182803 RepID=A0A4Y2DWX7_ARAVE|nr:hypothetical protein AVEN_261693-1 [Araneus ventricosus]